MKAYVFPGQAAQYEGMGKDMYDASDVAKRYFDQANEILGFSITDIMFEGSMEALTATKVTQPAVFLHSVIKIFMQESPIQASAMAGHSLGEFSALVASGALDFENGLQLVAQRAAAMQRACEMQESTMAAILGMEDADIERICESVKEGIVVPANYNCPGQLVISGSFPGVQSAMEKLTAAGAKRAILLNVGGAFHSPLMAPAEEELRAAIENTIFNVPSCPIYQNVDAKPYSDPEKIQQNLIQQLTSPVRWTQTMGNMITDGINEFIEVGGNGKTLRGFIAKVDRNLPTSAL